MSSRDQPIVSFQTIVNSSVAEEEENMSFINSSRYSRRLQMAAMHPVGL